MKLVTVGDKTSGNEATGNPFSRGYIGIRVKSLAGF
jgi:hypothetical protein